MCDYLQAHGLQHSRLPCPSPTPRAFSNSRPSDWWWHPTISSSVIPFSSCLQSFPASGSSPGFVVVYVRRDFCCMTGLEKVGVWHRIKWQKWPYTGRQQRQLRKRQGLIDFSSLSQSFSCWELFSTSVLECRNVCFGQKGQSIHTSSTFVSTRLK